MEIDVNTGGKAKMATTIELKSSAFRREIMAEDTNIMSEPSKLSAPPPATTTDSSSSISASLDKLTAEVTQLRQEIK